MRNLPHLIRKLYDTAEKHKVTIPAAIRKDLDTHLEVIKRAESATFTGETIGAAVISALMADRDPVTDPNVQAAIVRDRMNSTQTINQIVETSTTMLHSAIREHMEEIFEAFKPAYNKAGATFTDAVQQLHEAGFSNTAEGGHPNLELARANLDAREAETTITTLHQAITTLLVTAGSKNGTPLGRMVDRLDTGDAPSYQILNTLTQGWTLWDAVVAGYTISLATPNETDDRAAHAYAVQGTETAKAAHAAAHIKGW